MFRLYYNIFIINIFNSDEFCFAFLDVNCGDLPGIGNGSVTFINNSTAYGAKVVYKCNINYTLVGTDTRFCNEDGSWSDKEPLCFCKYYTYITF